jgi:hypothetical protein
LIYSNKKNEWQNYSDETIAEFKTRLELCRKAAVYAQRIDWLVSGDDGDDNFHKRLKHELSQIKLLLPPE